MDDNVDTSIPSLSNGTVGSRFVSENEINSAKEKRDQEWKAAYARLGQEPPPRPVDDIFDGRSLAEKLAANKITKQEEWEERNKLSNQFRALEEDEVQFLDNMAEDQRREERKRKLEEGEDLKGFREAVAARQKTEQTQSPPEVAPAAPAAKPAIPKKKAGLKGVQVKRKQPMPVSSKGKSAVVEPQAKRSKNE